MARVMFVWLVIAVAGCGGDRGWRSGTCFFVSPDGIAVTSRHVVVGNRYLMIVDAQNTKHRARVVAEDPVLDLAVLQIRYGSPAYLDVSTGDAHVGDRVLAFEPTALRPTTGLVVGAHGLGSDAMLATTAQAERGSSGGPLIDRAGRVVGVLVRLAPESKIAFAVKSSRLESLLQAVPAGTAAPGVAPIADDTGRAVCRIAAP